MVKKQPSEPRTFIVGVDNPDEFVEQNIRNSESLMKKRRDFLNPPAVQEKLPKKRKKL